MIFVLVMEYLKILPVSLYKALDPKTVPERNEKNN